MRRFVFMLVGLAILALAALILWGAIGPTPSENRTTGGVLYTQQEVASNPGPLGVVTDADMQGNVSTVPIQPEIAPDAMQPSTDFSAVTTAQEAPPAGSPPLTTDVVLNQDTGVTVAPLAVAAEAQIAPDGQGGANTAISGGYEQRVVEMEWPKSFRVDGADSVRIKLKMLENGALQPVAEIDSHEVVATPILLTDRYDLYVAYVTATISAPDFNVDGIEPAQQVLERGGTVEWRWTLKADHSGSSVIALGLNIYWEPRPGSGATAITAPIWGQTLQVDVNYVLGGLTVPQASVAGTVLAVLGVITEIPLLGNILGWFWNVLTGRNRRKRRYRDDRDYQYRRR